MRFLSRFFGRNSAPPTPSDMRVMNEDWKVGDLALCLASGSWACGYGPTKDSIHRVEDIAEGLLNGAGPLVYGLRFPEFGDEHFLVACFRKIRPEIDPCEEEFTALIKRGCKLPKREAA